VPPKAPFAVVAVTPSAPSSAGAGGDAVELELDLGGAEVVARRPDGEVVRASAWDELDRVTARPAVLPSGARGVLVDAEPARGQPSRWAVPGRRPGAVEAAVEAAARRHGVDPGTPDGAPSLLLTLPLVLLTGGVVALLLLAAGHVVHF
jgi:hypothetical protein